MVGLLNVGLVRRLRRFCARLCRVVKRRRGVVALACLAVICGSIALSSALSGVQVKDLPLYWADQAGIVNANEGVSAQQQGSYTTFQSVSDQLWEADSLEQDIVLANPSGNEVDMAPHIYVDLNQDGEFSNEECVWNPATYDQSGNLVDRGALIAPGAQVGVITLTQPVPAGRYTAKVVFSSYLSGSHDPANPMSFQFNLESA